MQEIRKEDYTIIKYILNVQNVNSVIIKKTCQLLTRKKLLKKWRITSLFKRGYMENTTNQLPHRTDPEVDEINKSIDDYKNNKFARGIFNGLIIIILIIFIAVFLYNTKWIKEKAISKIVQKITAEE